MVCGGGRKNKYLINSISKSVDIFKDSKKTNLYSIDEYGIDGDFVESQAFGYLAIRSFLNLPISFPNTTGCKKPISGGETIQNF